MENYLQNASYPESGGSSPRSREIEFENPPPWDDSQNQPPPNYRVKVMCSYGGKIHPRANDNQLSYVGGETKILAVERNIKFSSLLLKLISLSDSDSISFKYQIPGEDLDALISVSNDDDLEHMMHEYDLLYRASPKPARLRIFIFPGGSSSTQNPRLNSSARSFGSEEMKSEKEGLVEALNSPPIITQAPPPVAAQPQGRTSKVDFLFGLEKANAMAVAPPPPSPPQPPIVGRGKELEEPVGVPVVNDRFGSDPIQKHIQDLQRLRLEDEQQRRKSDDSPSFTGVDYYKLPEKIPSATLPSGVPYWPDNNKPAHGGVFPGTNVNNESPVYMIPAPSTAYHSPVVRPVTVSPTQGYYTVQRIPSEIYREQQQMYNVIPPSPVANVPAMSPPQKVTGYPDAYGIVRSPTTGGIGVSTEMGGYAMVRPAATGGISVPPESGYAQVAYDGGMGRPVVYATPGGVIGSPAAGQYQAIGAASGGDMRYGGPLNQEAGVKVVAKATQGSI